MKIFKKAVSAFLASIMCIPSGVISTASAEENTGNSVTTVTLTESENGIMQFSQECMDASTSDQSGYNMMQVNDAGELEQIENDGSIWAFNKGDSVEIELIPDNGYEPSSFKIKNSDGNVMAEKNTTDNVFSFVMPGESITVEAEFSKEGTSSLWERPALTDKDAIALQKRIDALPEALEYYDDSYQNDSTKERSKFNSEVEEIRNIYFNSFTDEQRAQVDAGKLYTAVLNLHTFKRTKEKEISQKEVNNIQEKVDDLADVEEIAEPLETEENGYALCSYSSNNTGMKLSDEKIDDLFLEIEELTKILDGVDPGELGDTDLFTLYQLQGFFTTGTGLISTYASGSDVTGLGFLKGTWNSNFDAENIQPKGGYYYSEGLNDDYECNNWNMHNKFHYNDLGATRTYESLAYCACADWPRDKSKKTNKRVDFDADQIGRLSVAMGGSIRDPDDSDKDILIEKCSVCGEQHHIRVDGDPMGVTLMMRLILWYGFNGPGYKKDGMPKVTYAATHTALSYAYSGQIGKAPNGNWKKFYRACARRVAAFRHHHWSNDLLPAENAWKYAEKMGVSKGKINGEKVEFNDFGIYAIIPKVDKHQHIFFYNATHEEITKPDPFNLFLFKVNSTGKKLSNSSLAGARFRISYFEKEYTHAEDTVGKKANAIYEFETKEISLGSEQFKDKANQIAKQQGIDVDYGVDFWPKEIKDGEMKNDFLVLNDSKSPYGKYFGEPGTYVISEVSPPQGYTLTGKMYYDKNSVQSALKTGLSVIYHENGKYSIEGIDAGTNPDVVAEQNAIMVDETPPMPEIRSQAVFPSTGQQYTDPDGTVEIKDTIWIKTIPNQEAQYTITTNVIDLTTNAYLNVHWTWNGQEKVDERSYVLKTVWHTRDNTFNPGDEKEYHITGTIEASGLKNHKLVFINKLVTKEFASGVGEELCDPIITSKNDQAETLYFSESNTDILSSHTGRKGNAGESIILADGMQTLTDTVYYKNLIPNRTYKVRGYLVDTETQNLAVDKSGTPIQSVIKTEKQQSSNTGEGSWKIDYTFDATNCGGRKYVSCVEIYLDDELVASYKNTDDPKESFYLPSITTKLTSTATGTDVTYAANTITLNDNITYKKFLPGANYKIETELIDMSTGKTLLDANNKEVKFTIEKRATSIDGVFVIPISFAGTSATKSLAGKVIVCYERIYIEKNSEGSGEWVLVASHEKFWDKNQRMYIPVITTTAADLETDKRVSYADDKIKIIDTVHYSAIRPGYTYILESQLIDAATGSVVVDDNNKRQELTTQFLADYDLRDNQYLSYGDITPMPEGKDATFELNASSFAGRTLVVYQRLYLQTSTGKHLVADHTDITDKKQTIQIPKIWTNAVDQETQTSVTYMGNGTSIITDTISYENLLVGEQYVVEGVLIDREKTLASGTPVAAIGPDGNACRVTSPRFTATSSSGTYKVSFEVDTARYASQLKTHKSAVFVVYEELKIVKGNEGSDDTTIVASHKDINDKNQTIYLPEITTELLDSGNGTHLLYAGPNAHLTETINYYHMKPLTNYTVKGRLYNMETGKVLTDSNGNRVEVEETRMSNSSGTGTWTLDYRFDASKLQGTIVVAFAEVYINNGKNSSVLSIVADHNEFWDTEERVHIPKITTDVIDQKTGDQISLAEKTMKIIDTVHYKSLSTGYTYRLESELRDQATGEIVVDNAGKKQVLTTHFSLDFELEDKQYLTHGDLVPKAEGSDATFEVDAEYFAGRTLVVFQRLYVENNYGSGNHLIAEHQDLLDERQTIPVPGIRSNAFDLDNFTKTSMAGGRATIIDTVSYNNLVPGWTYELQGYVVDKYQTIKAGENIVVTGTDGKPARNSITFTPSSSSGTVRIPFEVDTSKYASDEYKGAVFVVYQELYVIQRYEGDDDRSLVATHTDIGNLNQTMYIPYIWTDLNDYKTGTKVLNAEQDAQMVDTISYTRFQPNTSYTVKGKIIDMETGAVLTDSSGKRVEKEMKVTTSDTGTGSWDLHYKFDASELQGKVLVAYADVYVQNGEKKDILNRVATHSSFWDNRQRVYIPLISTVATDQKTNSHVTYAEDNVWITDRIYYSHLPENTEYKLISKLVDKDTGEVVRGK